MDSGNPAEFHALSGAVPLDIKKGLHIAHLVTREDRKEKLERGSVGARLSHLDDDPHLVAGGAGEIGDQLLA